MSERMKAGIDNTEPIGLARGATGDPWAVLQQVGKMFEGVRERDALIAQTLERVLEAEEAREKQYLAPIETYTWQHNPATDNGKSYVYLSKVFKGKMSGFSLSTLQAGTAAGADVRDTTVYLRFDDVMPLSGNYPAPNVYDLFVPIGGKLNQYKTVKHVNVITFYSRTAFEGVLFLTSGDPSRLPGL